LKIALIALTGIAVVVAAAATAGTRWLHDQQKTTEYCASCHAMASYYDTWKASDFAAHAHAKAGIACQDCHPRTTRDALREFVVSATHSDERPIASHKASAEECLRCHGSHEILASRTNSLVGPDGFTLGRNPHDSHWGPLDCGICHNMHKPSVDLCSKCHGAPASGAAWAQPTR
jgi:nitrate/TMAO reductase-like tetraheme cytochrome c subunit